MKKDSSKTLDSGTGGWVPLAYRKQRNHPERCHGSSLR